MKGFAESGIRSAAIVPMALFLSQKGWLNYKSIEYRMEYVKDFLPTGSPNRSNWGKAPGSTRTIDA
jgi:hypothetical protein